MKLDGCAGPAITMCLVTSVAACAPTPEYELRTEDGQHHVTEAAAVLHSTVSGEAHGTVTFTAHDAGIAIRADLVELDPGDHGFHIHELGDCTAADASSAEGHFAPEGAPHGAPADAQRHVGDLGNVTANETGSAHSERLDSLIALDGPHSIIGRAVIIHRDADDLESQPSGSAGPRVACGVIGIARVAGPAEPT